MSALAAEHEPQRGLGWDELVRVWETLDAPEGQRVEIIEGIITVAPPPTGNHAVAASQVTRMLHAVLPEDWHALQVLGLEIAEEGGIYIPDVAVLPVDRVLGRKVASARDAVLVVEVTSESNAGHDRVQKAHGYAKAGVPLYLLLDGWAKPPRATLFGEPDDGTYRVLQSVEYGEKLHLPAPFDVVIDTKKVPAR